jgi:hypothetical protein
MTKKHFGEKMHTKFILLQNGPIFQLTIHPKSASIVYHFLEDCTSSKEIWYNVPQNLMVILSSCFQKYCSSMASKLIAEV